MVADLIKFQFFHVLFGCTVDSMSEPSIRATTSQECSIWCAHFTSAPNMADCRCVSYYAMMITGLAVLVAPRVNEGYQGLRILDQWWCKRLLESDLQTLKALSECIYCFESALRLQPS